VQTLAQLRNEGKIRLVALSNVTQEHIERARKIVPSFPSRTAIASQTANGTTWWIIVSAMELLLFLGSH
jgi:aryl-alcohol dehydrogenase-like predicted oxidoreductase